MHSMDFLAHLYTLLWSMVPFFELRLSIPLGYSKFDLSIYSSVFISVIGGIIVAAVILQLLPVFMEFFEKYVPVFDKIMKKVLAKTRKEHSHKMAVIGETFLVLFIAVPLPGSGAFTGSLICYLFKIPYKKALLLISLGILCSGIVVGVITLGVDVVLDQLKDAIPEGLEEVIPSSGK